MQRGDERQPALWRQHLLRQQRGNGMRNGVVHVQQIQVVIVRHLGHARRQRQAVRRILEQRIVGNFHFVIVDARSPRIQADRIRVGDEVDFVPALGQLQAQFGGHDAAAAVGGIAGDSDFHTISVLP